MRPTSLRIAITGGGTGGHLSPAIAVIEELRRLSPGPGLRLLYLGSRDGAEARVIPVMGVAYKAVSTGKLRRYLSAENVFDALRVPVGTVQSLWHLARYRPHALLATGGYVSVPPVLAAGLLRIPVLLHEQTGALGLANRISARFATRIALSVPGSERGLPEGKWVLTGNPVRRNVLTGDRATALRRYRFDPHTPTIYVTGGAQGSRAINTVVGDALRSLLEQAQVVHQCGDSGGTHADYEALSRKAQDLPERLQGRYRLVQYVGQEIGEVYALADLVVGRAGAGTVNELSTLGKPSVLVPLPHAAGDEQRLNAKRLEAAGGAVIIEETALTPERLVSELRALLSNPGGMRAMGEAARSHGSGHAARKIAELVLEIAGAENGAYPTHRGT